MPLPPPVAVGLTTLPSHDCNYLPGRVDTTRAFRIDRLSGELYHQFMDAGFRRSGEVVYQPVCENCHECVPIRVPVEKFVAGKSQRRSVQMNADLSISVSLPELTDEKCDLYHRYVTGWHGKTATVEQSRDSIRQFLYRSPVDTIEFCYRTPEQKLVGVGICDVCDRCLSSVYFYFDPQASRRSLGTFSAMHEIGWCRQNKIAFYYLGFWISGCGSMQYKSKFRPAEILGGDGIWKPYVETPGQI